MTAFATWWAFCMRPENDGQALHNDSRDPGGATAWGFTYATYQRIAAKADLDPRFQTFRAMGREAFGPLAHRFYWDVLIADRMPLPVAIIWADFNFTSSGATKCLQGVLRVTRDGVVGPVETLPAIATAYAVDPIGLVKRLTAARIAYYHGLGMPTFIAGWTRRANAGARLAAEHIKK